MMKTIIYALLAGAIILMVVTTILIIHGQKRNSTFHECSGTIVNFYKNSVEGRLGSYESVAISPVVEYEVNGARYELIGKYYSTNMKIGDTIKILFDEDNPSVASIKTELYFAPIITGSLALVLLVISGIFLIIKSKGIL